MVPFIGVLFVVVSMALLVLGQYVFWTARKTDVMKDEIPAWVAYMMYLLLPAFSAAFSVMAMMVGSESNLSNLLKVALLAISGVVMMMNLTAAVDVLRELKLSRQKSAGLLSE